MHHKVTPLEMGHWVGDRRQACITMESSSKGRFTSTASCKAGRVGIIITISPSQMWKPSPRGEAESHSAIWPSEGEMSEVTEGGVKRTKEQRQEFFSVEGERSMQHARNGSCSRFCTLGRHH